MSGYLRVFKDLVYNYVIVFAVTYHSFYSVAYSRSQDINNIHKITVRTQNRSSNFSPVESNVVAITLALFP